MSRKPSLLDIQAQQAREARPAYQLGGRPRNNRRLSPKPPGRRGGQPDTSQYPLEQGVICSLRDNFGFIHCAQRIDEIFFHYSQVSGTHPDDLQIDDEVSFRVGPSQRAGDDKLAAFVVQKLPPGTIEWEKEEQPGVRFTGLVEKAARDNYRGPSAAGVDGTIRILMNDDDDDSKNEDGNGAGDEKDGSEGATKTKAKADGPLIRFTTNDYQPSAAQSSSSSSNSRRSNNRGGGRLSRGDLVEFTVIVDSRTQNKYAREIKLMLSEKERARQEAERKMMDSATLERGVVTTLKGEYGFLKSNKRREEVFFHYSSVTLPEEEDGDDGAVLQAGQELEFLVVEEPNTDAPPARSGKLRRRVSARRIKMQPRGSVKFHDVLAVGMTGTVMICPQPVDTSHSLELRGKVRLHTPIPDVDENGQERLVTEVYLTSKDSPGGTYSHHGGTEEGVWVAVGDTLLFDVWKDFVDDGACHAAPTKCSKASETPLDIGNARASSSYLAEESDQEEEECRVRLIGLTLAMRAEGVINAVKDSYGFIHFAERPVDAHFKFFQLLPDALQHDIRNAMGIGHVDALGNPLRMEPNVPVHFDLSVHGNIHNSRNRLKPTAGERENLKAQRILLLPPNTVAMQHARCSQVAGVVTKVDARQTYAGTVELEEAVHPMKVEERHPLNAKLLRDYVQDETAMFPLCFRDIQSVKEDMVLLELMETLPELKGKLELTHVKQADAPQYEGRVCIRKIEESADNDADAENAADQPVEAIDDTKEGESDDADGSSPPGASASDSKSEKRSPKKKPKKPKAPVKSLRFDKGGLCQDLREDVPPRLGDKIKCNVIQSRRTGQLLLEEVEITERVDPGISAEDGTKCVGVVHELVAARQFGFISLLDEESEAQELLYFNLKSVVGESKNEQVRKGDEVSFEIGTEKNGKRVARNISILARGTIPGKADANACKGIVLLEPTATSLRNGKSRLGKGASLKSGRWGGLEQDRKNTEVEEAITELGCILLVEDPANLFGDGSHLLSSQIRYKLGGLAIHGTGSSSMTNKSTHPKRGDMVTFVKAKKGDGVRDIRVEARKTATMLRGRLEDIKDGMAVFYAANEAEDKYDVALTEVVSCDPAVLKEKESVEGVLQDGRIFGICRTMDLYLESKVSNSSLKERPKLNLAVKKEGVVARAQAKGPDGTNGFPAGWTDRVSKFAVAAVEPDTTSEEAKTEEETGNNEE